MGNDPRGEEGEMDAATQKPDIEKGWPQPDWQSEKGQPTRALWRIAVMAGNLKPDKALRDRRINADEIWGREYSMLLDAMKDALSFDPAHTEHIYCNTEHAGNAARLERPTRLSELSVDMLSALKFIERRLGTEKMPAGMSEVLRFKQSNPPASYGVSVATKKQSDSAAFVPKRSQDTGNETKASTRLKSLLYAAMLWEAVKEPHEGKKSVVIELITEKLEEIVKKYGLERIHGFGAHGLDTLTKDLAFSYYHTLDPSTRREDIPNDEPIMGSPSVS